MSDYDPAGLLTRPEAAPAPDNNHRPGSNHLSFWSAIEPRQLLQPYERLPGIVYFVKDAESRLMAVTSGVARRLGLEADEELIGKRPHEFAPKDLADKYVADDQWVVRNGKPMLNILEMGYNEQRLRDWVVTDKFPLIGAGGQVVGVVGISQSFEGRRQQLAHLGPVGRAADYIRDHLGDRLRLAEVAAYVAISERQLERLFRRAFGMTIRQFIIHSRVHAATRELTQSDKSVAQIAATLGFSDQSALSNAFRKVIGIAPRAYRERYVAKFTP
jgi:AraC-like DNA-binding protein